MSFREVPAPVQTVGPKPQDDARTRATIASVFSLLFGLAPFVITIVAVMLGPSLPYPAGALISFVLVALCVVLALLSGIRGLFLVREAVAQLPPVRRWGTVAAVAQQADRGLRALRILAIAGIVLGGMHGLFLLGSLALTVPGIVWMMSIAR